MYPYRYMLSLLWRVRGCFASLGLLALPIVAEAQAGFKIELHSYIFPKTMDELLLSILNIFIVVATPIIVLFIVYAGFLYVTAQGNSQQVQTATRAITYAVIGAVLIIGAVAIAEIIQSTVGAFQTNQS